ncbi:MAG: hypothetical protein KDD82_07360 [Planctomycetes bacterium]|nr:hypothetical protein [Planctomycetota bacterium]
MSLETGATVGGWTLGESLGGGRTARFEARHGDGRTGVLTAYPLDEGGVGGQVHRAQRERLEAWSKTAEKKVPTAGDWGVTRELLCVVLPEPAPRADEEPWALGRALKFVAQVAELLEPAHAAGVAHGELDPWTVLTDPQGPRLLPPGSRPGPLELFALGIHVDPRYASPELLDRGTPTPKADVYSLGLLLQRLVSGQAPVSAADPIAALAARGEGELALSQEAAPYLAHLLAPPAQRPATAREVKALLSGGPPPPPQPRTVLTVQRGRSPVPLYLFGLALLAAVAGAVFARALTPTPADPAAGYSFDLAPYRE